jgi:uncharacterized protein
VSDPVAPVPPTPPKAVRKQPVRTCVGCRQRSVRSELARIVAHSDERGSVLVLDTEGRLPGRGAHLHPQVECLDKALRTRGFARALRLTGPVDTRPVEDVLRSSQVEQDPRV